MHGKEGKKKTVKKRKKTRFVYLFLSDCGEGEKRKRWKRGGNERRVRAKEGVKEKEGKHTYCLFLSHGDKGDRQKGGGRKGGRGKERNQVKGERKNGKRKRKMERRERKRESPYCLLVFLSPC